MNSTCNSINLDFDICTYLLFLDDGY